MGLEIVALGPDDAARVMAASHLFDSTPPTASSERFLQRQGHHLFIAYFDGEPVGFVSGMEIGHPDKGTEMLLYQLGVNAPFRERGIGRALVDRLASLARDLGCYGMWAVTDHDNGAARAVYEGSGGRAEPEQVVEVWTFTS